MLLLKTSGVYKSVNIRPTRLSFENPVTNEPVEFRPLFPVF